MKEILVTEKEMVFLFTFPRIAKSDDPRWVFSTFLKLYKLYQIAQRIT